MTAMLLVCAFSCVDDIIPEPAPGPSPDTPENEQTAPVLTAESSLLFLYPHACGRSAELPFTVEGLASDGRVTLTEQAGLSLSLSFERETGKGTVTVAPTEEFSEYDAFTICASNGDAGTALGIEVEEARVGTPDPSAFVFAPEGGEKEVRVSSNMPLEARALEGWLSVTQVSPDTFVVSAAENATENPRWGSVVVSTADGLLPMSVSVEQAAPDHSQEITGERAALEAVYRALGGEGWSEQEGWCTDAPLRQWYGVMTNTYKGEEHVVYLHLQHLGARGDLPSEIGQLPYLRELWIIGDEGITGSIPASWGALENLRDLSLSGTSVGGPVPDCLHSLQKLEILGLDGNYFTGNLPLWLADMPSLRNFGFWGNCLDGKIDPSLTETAWWNARSASGTPLGEENLSRGQREGHALYL